MAKTPARNHELPGPPQYRKTTSYSPEQSDHNAMFFDRGAYTETDSLRSPAPPNKSWGIGSYDDRGRALEESGGKYGGGNSVLGGSDPVPMPTPPRPRRPGRW